MLAHVLILRGRDDEVRNILAEFQKKSYGEYLNLLYVYCAVMLVFYSQNKDMIPRDLHPTVNQALGSNILG